MHSLGFGWLLDYSLASQQCAGVRVLFQSLLPGHVGPQHGTHCAFSFCLHPCPSLAIVPPYRRRKAL